MLSPTVLHDLLRREQQVLAHRQCDLDVLYDRATIACLIVSALRRYAALHQDVLDSALQRQVARTLHEAERELHWLTLCGGDAEESDLLAAVRSALASAERAAALLRSDVSGVFIAATETESSTQDGRRREIAG